MDSYITTTTPTLQLVDSIHDGIIDIQHTQPIQYNDIHQIHSNLQSNPPTSQLQSNLDAINSRLGLVEKHAAVDANNNNSNSEQGHQFDSESLHEEMKLFIEPITNQIYEHISQHNITYDSKIDSINSILVTHIDEYTTQKGQNYDQFTHLSTESTQHNEQIESLLTHIQQLQQQFNIYHNNIVEYKNEQSEQYNSIVSTLDKLQEQVTAIDALISNSSSGRNQSIPSVAGVREGEEQTGTGDRQIPGDVAVTPHVNEAATCPEHILVVDDNSSTEARLKLLSESIEALRLRVDKINNSMLPASSATTAPTASTPPFSSMPVHIDETPLSPPPSVGLAINIPIKLSTLLALPQSSGSLSPIKRRQNYDDPAAMINRVEKRMRFCEETMAKSIATLRGYRYVYIIVLLLSYVWLIYGCYVLCIVNIAGYNCAYQLKNKAFNLPYSA